jgi:hypothetical protein
VKILSELADVDASEFPTEVTYQYTATQGKGAFRTEDEDLTIEDPDSAEQAAQGLEKRLDRLGRLRDGMLDELKRQKSTVGEAKSEVEDFVRGALPLVADVLATLV